MSSLGLLGRPPSCFKSSKSTLTSSLGIALVVNKPKRSVRCPSKRLNRGFFQIDEGAICPLQMHDKDQSSGRNKVLEDIKKAIIGLTVE